MVIRTSDSISVQTNGGTQPLSAANTTSQGLFLMSRIANNNLKAYGNGTQLGSNTNTETGTLPVNNIYLAARNDSGAGGAFSNKEVAFATIGDGVSSSMAQYMFSDIEAFQTALGRNVAGGSGTDFTNPTTGPVLSIGGTGTAWNNTGVVIPGLSTIKLTNTGSGLKTFKGGGQTYYNLSMEGSTGGGSYEVLDSNTFNDFKDIGTVAHSLLFETAKTQTLKTFTMTGAGAGNLITINSSNGVGSTSTGIHTLTKIGADADVNANYLNIQHSVVTPVGKWLAGSNSVDNQSTATAGSGWIFNTLRGYRGGNINRGGDSERTTATGTVVLSGNTVASITVTSGGSGYTTAPIISICGGGGTGAVATATISGGVVQSNPTINNAGSGYNSSVTVYFGTNCPTTGGGAGGGASPTATGNVVLSGNIVASITVTSGGSGYTTAPTITFCGGGGTGAVATASISGGVVQANPTINNAGSGYNSSVKVYFGSNCPATGGGAGGGGDSGFLYDKETMLANAGSAPVQNKLKLSSVFRMLFMPFYWW
jgi:hypothetical protein